MKKSMKMISIVLLVVMALMTVSNVVFASGAVGDAITNMKPTEVNTNVTNFGQKIVNLVQTVGIVIAVVVVLILGIQYMMGSAEQKAEYKKTMIPYLVGAVLIFAATSIVKVVYDLSQTLVS